MTSGAALLVQQTTSPPQVHHPLLYHPASLSSPGSAPYVPSDLRNAYDFSPLYSDGVNGTGTSIAVIDAYGDPTISTDLASFDSLTSLPQASLSIHYPDGTPRFRDSGWALETALDVEWAHAIAPAASIDLVVVPDSSLLHIYDGISYVANSLTSETVLSMSFGLAESQYPTTGSGSIAATHQLFVTMTSHGTSLFASSGDSGASDCCTVSYPASDPLVVAVGGTSLTLNSTASYVSESAWSGSGAGASLVFAKPSWQQGLGDSSRDIVDVSYDADPNTGVFVVQGGAQFEVGGTSAGSPQWAALAALDSEANGGRLGSMDSRLYNLSGYHDVTTGSDGFFSAGPGWDYPTGLGSPDATLLVNNLIQPPVQVNNTTNFQGLAITTRGNLTIDTVRSEVSGIVQVTATNTTTSALEYSKNYTVTGVRLLSQTSIEMARFLLSVPVGPFPLSVDLALSKTGKTTQLVLSVSRRVNISGSATVDVVDVGVVSSEFNAVSGAANYNPHADLNATGTIGLIDVSLVDFYFNAPIFT